MKRGKFMQKSQVGTGKGERQFALQRRGEAIERVQSHNSKKVPVWVPELKMTIYVMPGTDMAPIIKRHKEMKEWRGKTLHD